MIYDEVTSLPKSDATAEWMVTFELPLSDKLALTESLDLVAKQGYQRLLWKGEPLRIEDAEPKLRDAKPRSLTVIQDRLRTSAAVRSRFVEACEQAYHFGKGRLLLWKQTPASGGGNAMAWSVARAYSNHFHCAECDIDYREPTAALFSFNHPVGACPTCRGFGRIITIDYNLAIPDRSKTLAGGLVKPWQTGVSADCQRDLMKACKAARVPTQVPFRELSREHQEWVIQGEPGYGQDKDHEWPHAWYRHQRLLPLAGIQGLQDACAGVALALSFLHRVLRLSWASVSTRDAALSGGVAHDRQAPGSWVTEETTAAQAVAPQPRHPGDFIGCRSPPPEAF